jgi:ketosteroid isomerase-like protein
VPVADLAVERAAVERAITEWFESGMAPLDTMAVRRGLADDFTILEDSVWYDGDGFVAFVAGLPALLGGPFTTRYELSDWRTTVEGDVAWTSMRNRAFIRLQNGSPLNLDWRETVVLRRRDGRWLIARYQSAPVR